MFPTSYRRSKQTLRVCPFSWKCEIAWLPACNLFDISIECSFSLQITSAEVLTISMIFKDKLIVALLLIHTAADVDDAILAGLVGHDAARGVVVGDHEVLYGAVGVVAERADPDAVIVLSPTGAK